MCHLETVEHLWVEVDRGRLSAALYLMLDGRSRDPAQVFVLCFDPAIDREKQVLPRSDG